MKIKRAKSRPRVLTLYSIITPFDALKYHVFENIMQNGANATFIIIFSKVFKTLLNFFLNFFQCLKIENDVMI